MAQVKEKLLLRVKPDLNKLLPTPELREAYEQASAAFEAGRFVRALRKEAHLTQEMLAERLAITQERVSAIEAGNGRDGPSYGLLKRIVEACGTSLAPALEGVVLRLHATMSRSSASKKLAG
jgi:DNA-binding XRE family transcriptional regulator